MKKSENARRLFIFCERDVYNAEYFRRVECDDSLNSLTSYAKTDYRQTSRKQSGEGSQLCQSVYFVPVRLL